MRTVNHGRNQWNVEKGRVRRRSQVQSRKIPEGWDVGRQAMNGAGMCKMVSRGDKVLLEGEGEEIRRNKVEPGLRKSLPPLDLIFLICKVSRTISAFQCCCNNYWRWQGQVPMKRLGSWKHIKYQFHSSTREEVVTQNQGKKDPQKNIYGDTHACTWTVRTSSVNLPSYHLSIFHTAIQTLTIHLPLITIHLAKCQFRLHPPCIPYPSSYIHHQPTIHLPIIHSISILHQSIYHLYFHSVSHPASHHNSIYLFIYHSSNHHSSAHHSLAINSHPPSFIQSLVPHPPILYASIYPSSSHPFIIPLVIYLSTLSHTSSIHSTYILHSFLHIHHSQVNYQVTNLGSICFSSIYYPYFILLLNIYHLLGTSFIIYEATYN